MGTIFLFCLITSLAITGIHVIFMEDKLMGKLIGNSMRNNLAEWVVNPLFDCLVCMAGLWTLIFFVLFQELIHPFNYQSIIAYGLVLIICMWVVFGLNAIWLMLISPLNEFDDKDFRS